MSAPQGGPRWLLLYRHSLDLAVYVDENGDVGVLLYGPDGGYRRADLGNVDTFIAAVRTAQQVSDHREPALFPARLLRPYLTVDLPGAVDEHQPSGATVGQEVPPPTSRDEG